MPNQKKSHNRLDDLFANLEQEASAHHLSLPGWTWECDLQGNYTACSTEVKDILGFDPGDFIGQPVSSHRLDSQFTGIVDAILNSDSFPAETVLKFPTNNGKVVTIRTLISKIETEDGDEVGWRGHNQVIESVEDKSEPQIATPLPSNDKDSEVGARAAALFRSYGLAMEGDQFIPVSEPFSGAAKTLPKRAQTSVSTGSGETPALIAVPVELPEQSLGLLEIIDDDPNRKWSQDELRLVEEVADQLALALDNARLFQEEQRRRQIAATLSETARVVGATLDLQEIGNRLLTQLSEVVTFDTASLQMIDGDERQLISGYNLETETHFVENPQLLKPVSQDPLIQKVVQNKQPILIRDAHTDPQWNWTPDTENVRSWIAAPLMTRDEVTGLLILDHSQPNTYDTDTADLISAIGAQVSVALRNASLFQQVQRRSVQLQTASEVSKAASSILEPNPLIQQTVDLIQERFDLYYVGFFLVDDTGQYTDDPGKWAVLRAGTGEAGRIQMERGHKLEVGGGSMIGECIQSGVAQTPSSVTDSEGLVRFTNPLLPETRTEIALPLISRGQTIGAMTIQSTQSDAFVEEDIAVLQTMADQVANALQNANLFDQTQARADELNILNEMSQALSASLEIETIIRNIFLFTSRLIDTSTFFVALYDSETDLVSFPMAIQENKELQIEPLKKGSGLTSYVLDTRETLLLTEGVEGLKQSLDDALDPRLAGVSAESWLGVPLMVGNQAIGVINVQNNSPRMFDEHDRDLMVAIASQSAIALQNANLFTQTQAALSETEELARRLAILNELAEELSTIESLDMAYNSIAAKTKTIFQADRVSIAMLTPDKRSYITQAMIGETKSSRIGEITPLAETAIETAVKENRIQIVSNTQDDTLGDIKSFMISPISAGGSIIGTVNIASVTETGFTQRDENLALQLASTIGATLENRQLFTQVQEALSETEALLNITRVASSSLDLRDTLSEVLDVVLNAIGFDIGLITLANPITDDLEIIAHRLPEAMYQNLTENGLDGTLCHLVYTRKEPVDVIDLKESPVEVASLVETGYVSYAGIPLETRGVILGTLCAFTKTQYAEDTLEKSISLMTAVGRQIGVAVENANLFEQTQEQAAELAVLNEMSQVLSTLLDIDQIIQTIYQYTSQLMDTTYFFVALYNQRDDTLSFPFVTEAGEVSSIPLMEKRKGLTQHVIDTRRPLLIEENVEEVIKDLGLEKINIGKPAKSWLGVPLILGDDVLGVIATQNANSERVFNIHHQDLLVSIARQSAIAIQTARLFQETRRQAENLDTLNEMGRVLSSQFDTEKISETVYAYTSRLMEANSFFVALYNEETEELTYPLAISDGKRFDQPNRKLGNGLTDHIIRSGETLLIQENVPKTMEEMGIDVIYMGDTRYPESWLGTPMSIGERVIGAIAVQSLEHPREYNEQHRDLLLSIASQAALTIQTSRLFQDSRQQTEDLDTLNEMGRELSSVFEIGKIAEIVYQYTGRLMEADNFYLALYDEIREEISFPLAINNQNRSDEPNRKLGNGLTDYIIRNKQTLLIEDNFLERQKALGIDLITMEADDTLPKSWLGTPMMVGNRVIGVIGVQCIEHPREYSEHHRDLLLSVASQAAITVQNAFLFDQTQQQLEDLTIIQETTSGLTESLSMDDVIQTVLSKISQAVEADTASFFTIPKENIMVHTGTYPVPEEGVSEIGEELLIENDPLTKEVIESGQPISFSADDPRLQDQARQEFEEAGIATHATIPMIGPEGVLGVIKISRIGPVQEFTNQELTLATTLSSQAAVALQNARLYEEQLETSEQLRELDTLKTQFLANMSHELRTPLNSIIGFSRVIMKGIDGPVTDLQKQDLSAIYNAGQHLLKMINDILDISKIDAGKMEISLEDVFIPDIINSVISTARGLIKDKPIKLVTAVDEDIPIFNADPTRIRQILLNLLSNAAKFTDEGSITVTARKQTSAQGTPEIYISVSDTGMGIAEEERDKLFEPFVQADGSPTRKTGGTGLGLSITRLLVELHGGEIFMESEPGKGSTFYFTLPLEPGSEPPPDVEGSNSILAVDDDLQVLHLYERYISDTGYNIVHLTDPSKVIEFAKEIQPFVITLDLLLPEHNGWDILEELRNTPETKAIPVIICSISDEKEKASEFGVEEYLTKPILAGDLVDAIQRIRELD